MKARAFTTCAFICMIACALLFYTNSITTATDEDGSRPRSIAVSSDGLTLLATSLSSPVVTQLKRSDIGDPWGPPLHIPVGGSSWGVAMLDDDRAVVTRPHENALVVLTRSGGDFSVSAYVTAPYYCTEVVKGPGDDQAFVSCQGEPPANATESWQHAVYEFTIAGNGSSGSLVRTILTERQPRAMTFSPDNTRLFVATIQGALGQAGLTPSSPLPSGVAKTPYDGGSILVYDISGSGDLDQPEYRIPVGSPVRGLAVWNHDPGNQYSLYFTHVGEGAQSEAPGMGGRAIPNVISRIAFDGSSNAPVASSRQDGIFSHDPDATSQIVLPEAIAIRAQSNPAELWVVNSGSGNAARVDLGTDGKLSSSGVINITQDVFEFPMIDPVIDREDFFVIKGRGGDEFFNSPADVGKATESAAYATVVFDDITNASAFNVCAGTGAHELNASNPRDIVLVNDGSTERVLVVNQLDHTVVEIDPDLTGSSAIVEIKPLTSTLNLSLVGEDERDFYTFGRGFDFRENPENPNIAAPMVQTLTCATCHIDGHTDGKVRFTVISDIQNITSSTSPPASIFFDPNGGSLLGKPVAVPSVRDAGETEWLFFEGSKTIVDAQLGTHGDPGVCDYCVFNGPTTGAAGFFFDTADFTSSLSTPIAPTSPVPDQQIAGAQLRGRFLFESMNCSRCHAGPTTEIFVRSNDPDVPLGDTGPLPATLETTNRLLHDPTQSFVNFVNGGLGPNLRASRRNMTDVGTRPGDEAVHNGINVPALAGAWDNEPYMHDGRYRTLDEVLQNTWLKVNDNYRAAGLVFDGLPDNAFDDAFPDTSQIDSVGGRSLEPFDVHRHRTGAPPAGLISVYDYLASVQYYQYPDARADLIAFLDALSSTTELCGPDADADEFLTAFTTLPGTGETVVKWKTTAPARCLVSWGPTGDPSVQTESDYGINHAVTLPTVAQGSYTIIVTAEVRTVCGEKVIREHTWSTSQGYAQITNNTDLVTCPAGDGDTLAVAIDIDDNVFSVDLPASAVRLGNPSGGDVMFWSGGAITATHAATSGNGYTTTIRHPYISGCSGGAVTTAAVYVDMAQVDPEMFGLLFLGNVTFQSKSYDAIPNGGVDSGDVGVLWAAYGTCSPDPNYNDCVDLSGDDCVNLSDFGSLAMHIDDAQPFGPPSTSPNIPESGMSVTMTRMIDPGQPGVSRFRAVLHGAGKASTVYAVFDHPLLHGYAASFTPVSGLPASVHAAVTQGDARHLYVYVSDLPDDDGAMEIGTVRIDGVPADAIEGEWQLLRGDVVRSDGTSERLTRLTNDEEAPRIVHTNALRANYPNPFNPSTTIAYSIAQDSDVSLEVYNVSGQLVRTLVSARQRADDYEVEWDGRNNAGQATSSGVYFYRLRAGSFTKTRKMVLLK